jgi:nicotinamidase/pyrazinamidase
VIEDACRGIDVDGSVAATRESFAPLGITAVAADAIA